eukprot:TRINITY_DN4947_c0_g1_i4.p1 TRINITY_DN4947_c0_g1~~TRINITY_DN4947_c0_g1_i4.p1  ORF type:complete len:284 (+),score=67.83 TRINITY_DN4947_c0_g1_i4:135-986(+)
MVRYPSRKGMGAGGRNQRDAVRKAAKKALVPGRVVEPAVVEPAVVEPAASVQQEVEEEGEQVKQKAIADNMASVMALFHEEIRITDEERSAYLSQIQQLEQQKTEAERQKTEAERQKAEADQAKQGVMHVADSQFAVCIVCMSEEATLVCIPCGHQCICAHCVEGLKRVDHKCPLCRTQVDSWVGVKKCTSKSIDAMDGVKLKSLMQDMANKLEEKFPKDKMPVLKLLMSFREVPTEVLRETQIGKKLNAFRSKSQNPDTVRLAASILDQWRASHKQRSLTLE